MNTLTLLLVTLGALRPSPPSALHVDPTLVDRSVYKTNGGVIIRYASDISFAGFESNCLMRAAVTATSNLVNQSAWTDGTAWFRLYDTWPCRGAGCGVLTETNWTRNADCPLGSVPGALAISSGRNGHVWYQAQCALVSPQHALTAAHMLPAVGEHYWWTDATNGHWTRRVIARTNISDVGIMLLDAPITSVPYLRVPPIGWMTNYAPGLLAYHLLPQARQMPAIAWKLYGAAYVHDVNQLSSSGIPTPVKTSIYPSVWQPDHTRFGADPGDSGSSVCLYDGEELLYLGGWYSSQQYDPVDRYAEKVSDLMETLSRDNGQTPYRLTHKQWSFVTY